MANLFKMDFVTNLFFAADRREAAHYSCDTRAQISMPSYV